jgi:hypothetical protein
MIQVIGILGLMFFLWIVAVYATLREEPEDGTVGAHQSEKAA